MRVSELWMRLCAHFKLPLPSGSDPDMYKLGLQGGLYKV